MIRDLVFDVGNVLLGFRTGKVLAEHGMNEEQIMRLYACMFEDPLWAEVDIGIIPFADLVEMFCQKAPDLREDILWLMDHYDLIKVDRPEVWERVRKLKEKGYGIYLLSNYGEYFYEKQFKDAPFMNWIDGAVISYEVNLIKPDPRIYQLLLDRYGLEAESCLFFDDLPENIRAAEELGFGVFRVESERQLISKLDSFCHSHQPNE